RCARRSRWTRPVVVRRSARSCSLIGTDPLGELLLPSAFSAVQAVLKSLNRGERGERGECRRRGVHQCLGPGLLESAYRACLTYELREAGLFVETEVPFPIEYERMRLDIGYRVDLIIERQLIVELKCVAKLMPIHDAQLLSYLKLGGISLGLLLNFHSYRLTDGMKRIVNQI
ncbi:MAG TPA: GxxExxY protein, partial [Gemmatimonadaceae bacterium]|nr:GxxExxY protein [Gemmatimonadaceae bacterium]